MLVCPAENLEHRSRAIFGKEVERADLPLFTVGQSAIDAAASAWGYFFGAEHYLYPETRLSLKWQFMDGVVVVLSLGAFFPLAHLWDGQNLSLLDEFMVKAGLGFTMLLGGTPKPAAEPAAEASPSDPSTPPDEPADSPG